MTKKQRKRVELLGRMSAIYDAALQTSGTRIEVQGGKYVILKGTPIKKDHAQTSQI